MTTEPAGEGPRELQFAPVHPDVLTAEEALDLHRIAGCTPAQLRKAIKDVDSTTPPQVLAVLFIAARRRDPDVTEEAFREALGAADWNQALIAFADVLIQGSQVLKDLAEQERTSAAASRVKAVPDPPASTDAAARIAEIAGGDADVG